MDMLENNRLVMYGMNMRNTMYGMNMRNTYLAVGSLQEAMKGSPMLPAICMDEWRWQWGSWAGVYPDGLASVQGCSFTQDKPCIALSYR